MSLSFVYSSQATGDPDIDNREEEQYPKEHKGKGRRVSQVKILEGRTEQGRHQSVAGLQLVLVDKEGHVEVVEGPDGAQDDGRRQHWLQQGQGDVAELVPARSAVDFGRL